MHEKDSVLLYLTCFKWMQSVVLIQMPKKWRESFQSNFKITFTVEKLRENMTHKRLGRKCRKRKRNGGDEEEEEGEGGGRSKWHSVPRSTSGTWLFRNESKATCYRDPENERREENQYRAIKHKAWLCGAEENLLFIKFTPPPRTHSP